MPIRSTPMSSRALTLAGVCVAIAGAVGCGHSNTVAGRDAAVRSNLTPELETLSQRPIDEDNMEAVTWDENLRMANEDWNKLWLMDRPSRLSRWRMPH